MPKRKSYFIKQKLNVTERIRSGETKAKHSREISIQQPILRCWVKEETNLKDTGREMSPTAAFRAT